MSAIGDNFHPAELLAGVAVGSALIAATNWDPRVVLIGAGIGAVVISATSSRWMFSVVAFIAMWLVTPIWGSLVPFVAERVPTVGDVITEPEQFADENAPATDEPIEAPPLPDPNADDEAPAEEVTE